MLHHLIDMLPASNVSGPGRDSAINLLVKQVPRKSQKNPDNSLSLWVIDQGEGMQNIWFTCGISQYVQISVVSVLFIIRITSINQFI